MAPETMRNNKCETLMLSAETMLRLILRMLGCVTLGARGPCR